MCPCGKDIKSGAVRKIDIEKGETGYAVFTHGKGGNTIGSFSKGYNNQYSLKSGGEPVAQISKSDGKSMEILFMTSDSHTAELYENSGFIASFDGYDTMSFDYSEMFELEYNGELVRCDLPEGEGFQNNIMICIEYEGKQIRRQPVGERKEFYFPDEKKGTSCYLQIMYNDKPLRVSNIIEF